MKRGPHKFRAMIAKEVKAMRLHQTMREAVKACPAPAIACVVKPLGRPNYQPETLASYDRHPLGSRVIQLMPKADEPGKYYCMSFKI